MKFSASIFAPLLFLPFAHAYTYGLGTSWLIGSGSSSTISKVTTSFNAGVPPTGQEGELILWSGLSNGTGDLLYTTLESWTDQSWCGGILGQWCLRTSVFGNRKQTDGPYAPVNANQSVSITFAREADKSGWTQTAVVNGSVISTLTSPSGTMTLFGVTTQCDDYCAGSTSPQLYSNTTIELDIADPSWGTTAIIGRGAYGDDTTDSSAMASTVVQGLSSPDGGKTWVVQKIIIPVM